MHCTRKTNGHGKNREMIFHKIKTENYTKDQKFQPMQQQVIIHITPKNLAKPFRFFPSTPTPQTAASIQHSPSLR